MVEQEKELPRELTEDLGTGPGCIRRLTTLGVTLVIVIAILLGIFCLRYVKVTQVGLRVWNVDVPGLAKRGAQNANILEPGYNVIIPGLHNIVVYDKIIQNFEMTNQAGPGIQADDPALKLMTAEGNQVWVDVTILYRIIADKANLVREEYATMDDIKNRGIRPVCKDLLVNALGQIERPEDFYSSSLRSEKAELALANMNIFFNPRGIQVEGLLIRDFWFRQDYEMEILRKTIAIQLDEVIHVITEARNAQAEAATKRAEITTTYNTEIARGTNAVLKIDVDAERYRLEKNAEGDLAILEAKAEGLSRIQDALKLEGGKVVVGLEYAKSLEGLSVVVLPSGKDGVNPLDVESTLDLINVGPQR